MRASQWFIFGITFMILGGMLANISSQAAIFCIHNSEDTISCIRTQVYSVFPYIFFLLGPICFINGFIEVWSKKKKEEERYRKVLDEVKEKDFVMKIIHKFKLKHLPLNIPELAHWSKVEGKEKEIDLEINKYVNEEVEELKKKYR